ncbi:hypothetical protein [Thiocapsa sp.]|uniref:DUF7931 domain-containing protein n=1 Tax=Thiocapsa sp. TaxID=2024551 RepID=UPI0025FE584A|nr:hypothetical protein [Thiocapsa sp.]
MKQPQPPHGPRLLETRREIRDAGIVVAQAARRELLVFDRTLDLDLYNTHAFIEAAKRLALARPNTPVRALLSHPEQGLKTGNQIVGLAQRLTSRIAIRRLADVPSRPDAFLISDERAYLKRPDAEGGEGILDMHGRMEARRLRADFEQMWEHAEVDAELRRLHL